MAQRPKRPRDTNELAKRIVDIATGDVEDDNRKAEAQARGGRIGGRLRSEALTSEERSAIARAAAAARWRKAR